MAETPEVWSQPVPRGLPPSYPSIEIAKIKPSRHQARKSFDDEKLKDLAESIRQEGLIEPVIVRPMGDYYELVSGERRLRACSLLGHLTIEAKVIQPVSEAEAAAKGLVENLQREDLNPVEEAEGFRTLLDLGDSHWNQDQIAKVVGKTQGYISQSLNILKLAAPVVENIRRLIISRSHGLELCRLQTPEEQIQVAEKAKDLNQKETRKLVDQMLRGGEKAAKSEKQGAESSNQGFRFTRKGAGVAITAYFPGTGDMSKFLEDLRAAYEAWSSKPTVTADHTAPAVTDEDAELLAAKKGPAALCARICGAEDSRTKMLEGKTWTDFGIATPEEGLRAFLDGKITERR
jgi:ParB family chromosome partitioning protein